MKNGFPKSPNQFEDRKQSKEDSSNLITNKKTNDDKSSSNKKQSGDIINSNFVLLNQIGKGAFGQIFLAYSIRDDIEVAVKKEIKKPQKTPQLYTESRVYKELLSISPTLDHSGTILLPQIESQGIAKFYGWGELVDSYYLIMEFLGPNLNELLLFCNTKRFTMSTVSLIALQMLNRIETIHKHNYLHRDIKPENFMIGNNCNSNAIYMIDFGLSKRYKNSKNHQHIRYREGRNLTGTARYVSINTHLGIEQSRRDDLESIGYLIIFFLKGSLPWQGLKGNEKYHRIMEKKLQIPTEILTYGLPDEVCAYMNYVKNLRFEDRPDYDFLKGLFVQILKNCASQYGITKEYLKFDWSFENPSETIWALYNTKRKNSFINEFGNNDIITPHVTNITTTGRGGGLSYNKKDMNRLLTKINESQEENNKGELTIEKTNENVPINVNKVFEEQRDSDSSFDSDDYNKKRGFNQNNFKQSLLKSTDINNNNNLEPKSNTNQRKGNEHKHEQSSEDDDSDSSSKTANEEFNSFNHSKQFALCQNEINQSKNAIDDKIDKYIFQIINGVQFYHQSNVNNSTISPIHSKDILNHSMIDDKGKMKSNITIDSEVNNNKSNADFKNSSICNKNNNNNNKFTNQPVNHNNNTDIPICSVSSEIIDNDNSKMLEFKTYSFKQSPQTKRNEEGYSCKSANPNSHFNNNNNNSNRIMNNNCNINNNYDNNPNNEKKITKELENPNSNILACPESNYNPESSSNTNEGSKTKSSPFVVQTPEFEEKSSSPSKFLQQNQTTISIEGGFNQPTIIEEEGEDNLFLKTKSKSLLKGNFPQKVDMKVSKETLIKLKKESYLKYYTVFADLGQGSYGKVKRVRHKKLNEERAMKIVNKQSESSHNEIDILRRISHPNILNIFEIYEDTKKYYIINELLNGGELFEFITNQGSFMENDAANLMKQILSAVNYLHNQYIVHRDLKPENIMLITKQNRSKNELKIIDFGTAIQTKPNQKLNKFIGTSYYIAPEVLDENYNEKCDIWSCGVIMYILLCGYPPFNGSSNVDIFHNIQFCEPQFTSEEWKEVSPMAIDLLRCMLNKIPSKRYSAELCLNHKWFREYDNEDGPGIKNDKKKLNQLKAVSRMTDFVQENKFKQAVMQFITNQFDIKQEEENLRQMFKEFDIEKTGQITKKVFLQEMGKLYDEHDAKELTDKIFNTLDLDGNGDISYNEFLTSIIDSKKLITADRLDKAFKLFDKDGNGKLSIEELSNVFGGDEKKWKAIISDVDMNDDGEVDFEEFKKIMTGIDSSNLIN